MSALAIEATDERFVAGQLLRRLGSAAEEMTPCEGDHFLGFRIRKSGWRLSRLLLSRVSLRKLARDPQMSEKLDYLTRDILRTAARRRSYVFPFRARFANE